MSDLLKKAAGAVGLEVAREGAMKTAYQSANYTPKPELEALIASFRPRATGHTLRRFGGDGDGAYLLPDDLEGIGACFSPGVSSVADFEDQLAREHGIRSHMADASVAAPPLDNPKFDFEAKFLGTRNDETFRRLDDWVAEKTADIADADLLLQMDIEGAEYPVLVDTSRETLRRFRIIVLELHDMHMIHNRFAAQMFGTVMHKLLEDFTVAHLHPNNVAPMIERHGIAVPPLLEITLLRNDRCAPGGPEPVIPHPLDIKNVAHLPDMVLPDIWWKNGA